MRTEVRRGRPGVLPSFLLLGVTLLLLVGLAEVVVRWGRLQSDTFTQPDPRVGWVHIPDRQGLYTSPEVRNEFVTNALGLVGPTHPQDKGSRRLLLLGDSFTESAQVEWEESWPALVERELGPRWEVWNAGVAGYGTSNALLYLREYGLSYNPDAVFLLFFTGNDVSDNSRALGSRIGSWAPQPYFELAGDSLLLRPAPVPVAATGPLARAKEWLREHSRAYLFVRERWHRIRAVSRQTGASKSGIPLTWHVYRKPLPADGDAAEWEEAWRLTARLLFELRRTCTDAGIPLVLGSLPTGWRIDPSLREDILAAYPALADTSVWDFSLPDERVAAIADSAAIPYLDLSPVLLSAVDSELPLYSDHLTLRGHRVVGQAVGSFLRRALAAEDP